ncbi:hypothetical protein AVEN_8542-1 [Araneus ventricosus]|uniref:Uncharacterized protein n=1 Tax=Araneus ventricosus TaxID=182803 RepID=A0A4Y2FL44_ARAVE|nr:hypothetical protein AVEN_8542-1 [Araneus ventricosus]
MHWWNESDSFIPAFSSREQLQVGERCRRHRNIISTCFSKCICNLVTLDVDMRRNPLQVNPAERNKANTGREPPFMAQAPSQDPNLEGRPSCKQRRTQSDHLHPTQQLRSDMNPLMGQRGLTDKYCISICHMLCPTNPQEIPAQGSAAQLPLLPRPRIIRAPFSSKKMDIDQGRLVDTFGTWGQHALLSRYVFQ